MPHAALLVAPARRRRGTHKGEWPNATIEGLPVSADRLVLVRSAATGRGGPVTWHKMGAGWSWLRTQPEDHARAAREGWEQVKRDLAAETYRLMVPLAIG